MAFSSLALILKKTKNERRLSFPLRNYARSRGQKKKKKLRRRHGRHGRRASTRRRPRSPRGPRRAAAAAAGRWRRRPSPCCRCRRRRYCRRVTCPSSSRFLLRPFLHPTSPCALVLPRPATERASLLRRRGPQPPADALQVERVAARAPDDRGVVPGELGLRGAPVEGGSADAADFVPGVPGPGGDGAPVLDGDAEGRRGRTGGGRGRRRSGVFCCYVFFFFKEKEEPGVSDRACIFFLLFDAGQGDNIFYMLARKRHGKEEDRVRDKEGKKGESNDALDTPIENDCLVSLHSLLSPSLSLLSR